MSQQTLTPLQRYIQYINFYLSLEGLRDVSLKRPNDIRRLRAYLEEDLKPKAVQRRGTPLITNIIEHRRNLHLALKELEQYEGK